jgi:hypothetical protein
MHRDATRPGPQSTGQAEEMAAQERSESDEPEEFSDATIEAGG